MRSANRLLTSSFAALMAGLGSAVAQDVPREDTLILDIDRTISTPDNFNWFTPGVKRQHGAHQLMWEPLFIVDYATGGPEPWLASGFEANDDFTVFTVTLREGVAWSDGEAFDADDFVFTAEMVLGDENLSEREAAAFRAQVESVEKVDGLTVRLNLRNANPRFVAEILSVRTFGTFLVMPEHIWSQAEDPATFAFNPPIGTGPYTFTSAATNRAIWDRNDDWWGVAAGFKPLPQPRRVIVLESGGEESRAQLVAANQLDVAHTVTLGTFEAIRFQNENVRSFRPELPYAWPDPCPRQLEFNTTAAPWDDPNMRRAVAMLIDRNQIVNVAYEGTTSASRSMFVQYAALEPHIANIEAAGFGVDPAGQREEAAALIEAAGWTQGSNGIYEKDGEPLTVNIHVNSASTEYTRTIDVIVEQLNRAGIQARSVPVENGVFWGEVLPLGSYEVSYSWLSCGSIDEPWTSMSRYTNASIAPIGERAPGFNNTGRWNTDATAAYTEIVDQMGTLPSDDPQVAELVVEAYRHLAEEVPFTPLVQASKLLPMNETYWTGWSTEENFYGNPSFWAGSAHKVIHNLQKAE